MIVDKQAHPPLDITAMLPDTATETGIHHLAKLCILIILRHIYMNTTLKTRIFFSGIKKGIILCSKIEKVDIEDKNDLAMVITYKGGDGK